jgi:hypothetical protein
MKADGLPETSVHFYQTAGHWIPEDGNIRMQSFFSDDSGLQAISHSYRFAGNIS